MKTQVGSANKKTHMNTCAHHNTKIIINSTFHTNSLHSNLQALVCTFCVNKETTNIVKKCDRK